MPRKKKAKGSTRKKTTKAKTRVRKDPKKEYLETITKQGIASVSKLSQDECVSNIPGRVSTGSISLDAQLRGVGEPEEWGGGIPLSRVTEIFGPWHIGKSTILDHIFASVQKQGGIAILADTETSRDRSYVNRIGVDIDELVYLEFKPEETHIENVLDVLGKTMDFWRTKYPDVPIVCGWDALAGTATQDEMDKGIQSESKHKPGSAAKAMSTAARVVAPKLKGSKVAFVILNHEYDTINTGPFAGKKRETYGGHGTRHMATVRIQLFSKGNWIKGPGGVVIGREVWAKLIKNRLGGCVEVMVPIVTGVGIDNFYSMFDDLKRAGFINTSGAWSSMNIDGDVLSFQGVNGFREKCDQMEGLYDRLVVAHGAVI